MNIRLSASREEEIARLQKEESDKRSVYEKAKAHYEDILKDTRNANIASYRIAKDQINKCEADVSCLLRHHSSS